ncbi:hypothetical protein GUITHDRAFT_146437 [Guillardia theta CCMP2712]|uniref:Uncharacterized protein n=1 Tax=Guillardia theta (strain CCMP2712) TaxID=905079 RepID=L1II69_GUITC|nr:hypothetical protein GUITHDRAFT_146437 [Guillardia theta CCMP2712]EKX35515.1 hypothetical protein GUITHDRAFT_146437 [Guillardia theta CCMP2712]|eukprot:XP_005822495.1 hypothetical protein GUITHDRAFT_146437 [Guillardia theta CCMP2712]
MPPTEHHCCKPAPPSSLPSMYHSQTLSAPSNRPPSQQPCSSPTPESSFFQYFGSPSLTACPVSDRRSIFLDFSLGYDEASHSRWIDAYEGLGFMRALSSSASQYVEYIGASTTQGEEEKEEEAGTGCGQGAARQEETKGSDGWEVQEDQHPCSVNLRVGDQEACAFEVQ